MMELVMQNLRLMGVLGAMLLGVQTANILFSLYYNMAALGERFSRRKMLRGLAKMGAVAAGSALLLSVFVLLPAVGTAAGIEEIPSWIRGLSAAGLLAVYAGAIASGAREALGKLTRILGGGGNTP